jgi:hypothetical protein
MKEHKYTIAFHVQWCHQHLAAWRFYRVMWRTFCSAALNGKVKLFFHWFDSMCDVMRWWCWRPLARRPAACNNLVPCSDTTVEAVLCLVDVQMPALPCAPLSGCSSEVSAVSNARCDLVATTSVMRTRCAQVRGWRDRQNSAPTMGGTARTQRRVVQVQIRASCTLGATTLTR